MISLADKTVIQNGEAVTLILPDCGQVVLADPLDPASGAPCSMPYGHLGRHVPTKPAVVA